MYLLQTLYALYMLRRVAFYADSTVRGLDFFSFNCIMVAERRIPEEVDEVNIIY